MRLWPLPLVTALRGTRPRDLQADLVAGLVLTALLIPAGMGYAQAAGLPPVYGLYASIAPLVAYAIAGPSRILVLGPDSSLAPLVAASIAPLAGGVSGRAVTLAAMLAVLSGVMCMVAAVLRAGFVAELLSLPVRYGYLAGIAAIVVVGQLRALLGIDGQAEGLLPGLRLAVDAVIDGAVHAPTAAVGVGTLVAVMVLRRVAPRVPAMLLAMLAAGLVSRFAELSARGVGMVGVVPRGVPWPRWPGLSVSEIGDLAAGAFGIALVAFADTSVLSRSYASRTGDDVDPDHELLALGLANVASGLFRGFPVSASASRTPAAESAGARTQLTGVVAAGAIVAVLVAAPGLFRLLPVAVLAAVVIAAAVRLVEPRSLVRLARARPGEFALATLTCTAVGVAGPVRGVLAAVVVSLLVFVAKAWRPHTTTLVRVDGSKGYHDADRHPEGRSVPGLVLYRFDAPLFFANAEVFRDDVIRRCGSRAESAGPARWLVVTAEPITDVDATAAEMLLTLRQELAQRGVVLAFAELKGHVREGLERFGLVAAVGPDRFFRTVGEAVHAYISEEGVAWVDWEDRRGT